MSWLFGDVPADVTDVHGWAAAAEAVESALAGHPVEVVPVRSDRAVDPNPQHWFNASQQLREDDA